MEFHGNSRKNDKEHHLYAIHDEEESDIFKYGISDKPVGEDGYSQRMREQVDYLNRAVGWIRYFAVILRGCLKIFIKAWFSGLEFSFLVYSFYRPIFEYWLTES